MERRLVAILAADVVGYSRLIGADETGTLSRGLLTSTQLLYLKCESSHPVTKERAGVRNLRWTAFRKLFASMRYACSDTVPAQIARDMGHKKASVSMDIYAEAMDHLGCRFEEIKFPDPSLWEKSA